MTTFIIHFSTGTSRHDEKRYSKRIERETWQAAASYAANVIGGRANTYVTSIEIEGPVFS